MGTFKFLRVISLILSITWFIAALFTSFNFYVMLMVVPLLAFALFIGKNLDQGCPKCSRLNAIKVREVVIASGVKGTPSITEKFCKYCGHIIPLTDYSVGTCPLCKKEGSLVYNQTDYVSTIQSFAQIALREVPQGDMYISYQCSEKVERCLNCGRKEIIVSVERGSRGKGDFSVDFMPYTSFSFWENEDGSWGKYR